MNDELNMNEIKLIQKLRIIGDDEDSIIGIAIIAIQEDIVDDVLGFIEKNDPDDFGDILMFLCLYMEPVETEE